VDIPLDDIASNPFQPRREFKEDELAELAASIVQQGMIQPLVVVKAQDPGADRPYVLVAGERRLRAARIASLAAVPCIIREADRRQMVEWALVENIQRADLNPLDRARAYREYMDRFSLTHAQAAERLGEPRATVTNYLRILDLEDSVQQMLLDDLLTFGHAKILAGLTGSPQRQVALAKRVAANKLSVRGLERLVDGAKAPDEARPPAPAGDEPGRPAYVRDLEEQLTRAVGTRVSIKPGRATNTGRIVIEYYSLDDFDRIGAALGLKPEP